MTLEAVDITAGYGRLIAVDRVSATIEPGAITAILGPNGSGKSTLVKCMAALLRPRSGTITLDGAPINQLPRRALARRLGVLPQRPVTPGGLTVREVVALGRWAHTRRFGGGDAGGHDAVSQAIAACDLEPLATRNASELSGGEQQRAHLAVALAQEPSVLLLDEPIAALDVHHQLETLALIRRLNRERGLTVGVVLHDLTLASRFADRVIVMESGRVRAMGPCHDTLTPELVSSVFRCRASLVAGGGGALWDFAPGDTESAPLDAAVPGARSS
ncbi:MAG: ABC transporter ATP-binding protein [Planctomycetota bacterium]